MIDWLLTKKLNALPHAGGWKDQPRRFINIALSLGSYYGALVEYKSALKLYKGKQLTEWIRNNQGTYNLVLEVKKITNGFNS